MNPALIIFGSLLPLVVLERVVLHILVRQRGRRQSCGQYYLLAIYKPLIIVAGFAVLITSRAKGLIPLLVVLSLGLLSVLVSYPIARYFHPRVGQGEVRQEGIEQPGT